MPLSRIGGSLLRLCRTLVKDCDCCCEPVDVWCQGDPPTVKVFGATFTLDQFVDAASSPYGIPYWKADGDLQAGKIVLVGGGQLPRVPDPNCTTNPCTFSYNCGHSSFGDYGANYFYAQQYDEADVLRFEAQGYLTFLPPDSYATSPPKESPHFKSVGGHTWTIKGVKFKWVYLPSGASGTETVGTEDFVFSDGGPCLP